MNAPRKRRTRPEHLGPILNRVLTGSGLDKAKAHQKLCEHWKQAVGPQMAGRTQLTGLKNSVLRVEVNSAAHLQELATFHKRGIIEKLRTLNRSLFIQDIEFRMGSF